jgi:hypothetical protein
MPPTFMPEFSVLHAARFSTEEAALIAAIPTARLAQQIAEGRLPLISRDAPGRGRSRQFMYADVLVCRLIAALTDVAHGMQLPVSTAVAVMECELGDSPAWRDDGWLRQVTVDALSSHPIHGAWPRHWRNRDLHNADWLRAARYDTGQWVGYFGGAPEPVTDHGGRRFFVALDGTRELVAADKIALGLLAQRDSETGQAARDVLAGKLEHLRCDAPHGRDPDLNPRPLPSTADNA